MQNPIVVVFNGPPRSGKDWAARYVMKALSDFGIESVEILRLSMPNKSALAAIHDTCLDLNDALPDEIEDEKDSVDPILGVTPRQFQIDFSESFMKPLYGDDIFGRIFAHRAKEIGRQVYLVPDCGFQEELDAIARYLQPDLHLIRLHRKGCDFSTDSRGYVATSIGSEHDIQADDPAELALKIDRWLDYMGWS